MSDILLDLSDLEGATTSTFSTGPRLSFPFYVDGYHTDGLDPAAHYIQVRRADPGGDGVTPLKLFLSADDPTANATDPNKRRPSISDFQFAQMAQALDTNDTGALMNLAQDGRAKTFTRIGGMVQADGLREVEGGYEARWIRPLRRDESDIKHRAIIGWTTVQKRGTERAIYDVECVLDDAATLVTSFVDLTATLRRIFDQNTLGRPGAYLRLLQKDDAGTVVRALIVGATGQGGGRIDRRDRREGQGWRESTVEEAMNDFLQTGAAKKLDVPSWGSQVAIEVIPVLIVTFGEKSIDKHRPPTTPYTLPDDAAGQGAGQGTAPATAPSTAYAISTVRLTGVVPQGESVPKFFVAGLAVPTTGELLKLVDLPTKAHAPDVKPVFAPIPKSTRTAPTDPSKPLDDNFAV